MPPRDTRDWTERHDGPPSLAAGVTLVESNPRLVFRALLPTGLVAVLFALFSQAARRPWEVLALAGLFAGISVVRAVYWRRRFAQRSLVSTPTHLILCESRQPVQWMPWAEVEHLTVRPSDPAPEWSRSGPHWFSVIPKPELKVMPARAFVGGFDEMLVSFRASKTAVAAVIREADARGVPHDVL